MTTWNEEHDTDKCGEGEIKNILMCQSVVDVPTTFGSDNHGYGTVHRGIGCPSSGSDAASNAIGCVRTARSDTKDHATNQTDEE